MKRNNIKKRIRAIGLAAVLMAGSLAISFATDVSEQNDTTSAENQTTATEEATTVPAKAVSFTDVKSSAWYYKTVMAMASAGAINGYPDGKFKPDGTITIAEFTKICVSYLDEAQPAGKYWYSNYFKRANELGISGLTLIDSEGNRPITRERMATMVDLCAEKLLKEDAAASTASDKYYAKKFTDAGEISSSYKTNVLSACARGLMNGFETNGVSTFQPQGSATRAQAATMIARLTDKDSRIAQPDYTEDPSRSGKTKVNQNGYCQELNVPPIFGNKAYKLVSGEEFLKMYPVDYATYDSDFNDFRFAYKHPYFDQIGFFDTNYSLTQGQRQHQGYVTSKACGFPEITLLAGTLIPTQDVDFWYFDPIGEDGLISKTNTVFIVTDDLYSLLLEQVKSGKIPLHGVDRPKFD